jgi:DNA helicase II / ATP-dependent DNA helicase PcrA
MRASVDKLVSLLQTNPSASFRDVLKLVAADRLFSIPESLYPFAVEAKTEDESSEDTRPGGKVDADRAESKRVALTGFLASPFRQIEPYVKYVSQAAPFDTHQNVKGREFPRVMVVMDDDEAKGFMFSYEKLFGTKALSTTDIERQRAKEDTTLDRTRRLFYVTCSRCELSLALVAYTAAPQALYKHVVEQGWFDTSEVEMI